MRSLRRARLWLAPLIIYCVMLAGCFTEAELDRAAKASRNIATYTGTSITLVRSFYETGQIPLAIKDVIADKLIAFSKAGKDFNELVITFSAQYKSGAVPPNVWATITASFVTVEKLFIEILDLIPQAAGLKDSKAFKIISAAVLAVAQILMQTARLDGRYYRDIKQRMKQFGVAYDPTAAYA